MTDHSKSAPGASRREPAVDAHALRRTVSGIFAALGLANVAADTVADALVDADLEGIGSHGVMLVPMYVDRIRHGSVSLETKGDVVRDRGAVAVIDGRNALGQLTAYQAVAIAADKAAEHGLGAVAVRNGFHFGTAGRFALALAERGHVGIVMCNTRPLLPAPGGSEAIVGNNPIAIALPSLMDGPPVVLDMATSAGAMGKIRMAAKSGAAIPPDWATDSAGRPTTDPAEAIKGMLLPAGGPKGFGLAFVIDLLCGGLSSGATGAEVRPLYGDPAVPYRCAHLFLAIDVAHFSDAGGFRDLVSGAARRARASRPAPGVRHVMSPGEPAWRARVANGDNCPVQSHVLESLRKLAGELGVDCDRLERRFE